MPTDRLPPRQPAATRKIHPMLTVRRVEITGSTSAESQLRLVANAGIRLRSFQTTLLNAKDCSGQRLYAGENTLSESSAAMEGRAV